jgi:lipopolysaccharide export system protein LptA
VPLAAALLAASVHAQDGKAGTQAQPVVVEADRIQGRQDLETVAEGNVVLRRGSLVLRDGSRCAFSSPQAVICFTAQSAAALWFGEPVSRGP